MCLESLAVDLSLDLFEYLSIIYLFHAVHNLRSHLNIFLLQHSQTVISKIDCSVLSVNFPIFKHHLQCNKLIHFGASWQTLLVILFRFQNQTYYHHCWTIARGLGFNSQKLSILSSSYESLLQGTDWPFCHNKLSIEKPLLYKLIHQYALYWGCEDLVSLISHSTLTYIYDEYKLLSFYRF